jgi:ATP-dependent RNA helicase DOB1
MILNMSRIEGISPEYMLQRSFYQFQNAAPLPRLQEGTIYYNCRKITITNYNFKFI